MGKSNQKQSNKANGRYERLLKGEITSGQYVESLQKEAASTRSGKKYSPARSGKRAASA